MGRTPGVIRYLILRISFGCILLIKLYISSLPNNDQLLGQSVRNHWGIENTQRLDVAFREDDCRIRKDNALQNFAVLRVIRFRFKKCFNPNERSRLMLEIFFCITKAISDLKWRKSDNIVSCRRNSNPSSIERFENIAANGIFEIANPMFSNDKADSQF